MSRHRKSESHGREKKGDRVESSRKHKRQHKSREIMSGILWSILQSFVLIVHIFVDKLVEFVLEWYWGQKQICPALTANSFITKSATELAELIRNGKLKSHDVVKAYIDRIKQINPVLNAVMDGPFEEALDEAKAIDERIEKGQISEDEFSKRPFLGVPFTTKDSTWVKDKLHTLGLLSRKNCKAKEDAEYVRLLKDAGAIIIAKTSVPEVNKWFETRNNIIGQTNNPYDNRRSVGGSSGGEGALIAACGTAFGIGTDIGGSVRIPALACGVFGHKPTTGVISTHGVTFRTGNESPTMVAAGPMARYATDLLPLFRVLVGPKNIKMLKLDEKVDVKKLKYYYIPNNKDMRISPVSKEMQSSMYKTIQHIADITGETVHLAELPGIEQTSRMWRYWMTQEPVDFGNLLGDGMKLNPILELGKKLIGRSEYTMGAIYCLMDSVFPKEDAKKMRELTQKCNDELENLLGDDGILFYPSAPTVAPFHYFGFIKMYNFHYFSLFNLLHVPATQVPLGLNSEGIPLGIQVVATKYRDRHCLAVAEELEKAFGGWVLPGQLIN